MDVVEGQADPDTIHTDMFFNGNVLTERTAGVENNSQKTVALQDRILSQEIA